MWRAMEPPPTPPNEGTTQPLPSRFDPAVSQPARFPSSEPTPRSPWSRLRLRSWRGASGLGIGGAALLLFPFLDHPGRWWVPVGLGLGALVLLALLRLDRLLRGWTWHVAGLVLVAALVASTGPWAWALAASIGVLVAGLLRLQSWRLAVVGVVLCAAAGTGYGLSIAQGAGQVATQQAQAHLQNRGQLGAPRATSVLPVLLNSIAHGDTGAVCDNLIAASAQPAFAAAVAQPDCAAAVRSLAAQVTATTDYARATAPSIRSGDGLSVDACRMTWGPVPVGPQLGQLDVGRTTGQTYVVTAFRPC